MEVILIEGVKMTTLDIKDLAQSDENSLILDILSNLSHTALAIRDHASKANLREHVHNSS